MQDDKNIIAVTSKNSTKKSYKQLSDETCCAILGAMKQIKDNGVDVSKKVDELAKTYDCSRATIYRIYNQAKCEVIGSNGKQKEEFCQEALMNRRRRNREKRSKNACKFIKASVFVREVINYMKEDPKVRSPEIAVYVLKHDRIDYGPDVCFKTIYTYIEKLLIADFKPFNLLRQQKRRQKNYKEYTPRESRGKSIEERPEEINSRTEFGHWEGDLVTGPRDGENGAYLTLIERMTRMYLMIPIPNKKSKSVYDALEKVKEKYGKNFNTIFQSITFDNGSEFSLWREMEDNLGLKIYFGRPYHSSDRGSNENANGLIRRFILKGTDIGKIDRLVSLNINMKINRMIRKLLGYKSAEDLFLEMLAKLGIQMTNIYPY